MTPQEVTLVQDSFQKVVPIAGVAADLFYDRLFEISPEVRPLFPQDLTDQKSKLMQMLGTVVTNLHQVETVVPAAEELGKRHVAYGVKDAHYDAVGSALLDTLQKGLGDDFTPEVKSAWVSAYTTLAGVMKTAAASVPAPAPAKKKGFFARLLNA